MHEKVKEYLDRKETEKLLERNEFLIKEGLFTKIYGPEGQTYATDKYPYYEIMPDGKILFYNKVVVPVTDEEYEQILKAKNATKKSADSKKESSDTVATVLYFVAFFLFIIGFIVGCSAGATNPASPKNDEFNLLLALIWWCGGFISGMFFIALGRIIVLLNKINNK